MNPFVRIIFIWRSDKLSGSAQSWSVTLDQMISFWLKKPMHHFVFKPLVKCWLQGVLVLKYGLFNDQSILVGFNCLTKRNFLGTKHSETSQKKIRERPTFEPGAAGFSNVKCERIQQSRKWMIQELPGPSNRSPIKTAYIGR